VSLNLVLITVLQGGAGGSTEIGKREKGSKRTYEISELRIAEGSKGKKARLN
jgi:hypothetical protein